MKLSKHLVFIVACLDIVLIVLTLSFGYATSVCFVQTATHTKTTAYGWYYKPRTDGQQPEKNTETEFIYNYDAYSVGDPDEKVIYLTFDAGYENGYTEEILDMLKEHDVPAAFFLVEHYVDSCPQLIRRMVEEGHLVCNHSTSHKDMAAMTDFETFKSELTNNEDTFYKITGEQMPKYFRPPSGRFSELCLQYAKELGYTTVFWSFAYADWYVDDQPSHDFAFSTIISRTHPGAIVLLHSTSKTNAEILGDVITEWQSMGYTLKSLDYLVSTYEPE